MQIVPELLAEQAVKAMQHAYAPYSHFQVGACVQADDGSLFCGANIENASFGLTNCAERSAIFALVSAGKRKIAAIAIAGSSEEACTPCGACRQVIREFAEPDTPIFLCNRSGKILHRTTLAQLLPRSFGPEFLTS